MMYFPFFTEGKSSESDANQVTFDNWFLRGIDVKSAALCAIEVKAMLVIHKSCQDHI